MLHASAGSCSAQTDIDFAIIQTKLNSVERFCCMEIIVEREAIFWFGIYSVEDGINQYLIKNFTAYGTKDIIFIFAFHFWIAWCMFACYKNEYYKNFIWHDLYYYSYGLHFVISNSSNIFLTVTENLFNFYHIFIKILQISRVRNFVSKKKLKLVHNNEKEIFSVINGFDN